MHFFVCLVAVVCLDFYLIASDMAARWKQVGSVCLRISIHSQDHSQYLNKIKSGSECAQMQREPRTRIKTNKLTVYAVPFSLCVSLSVRVKNIDTICPCMQRCGAHLSTTVHLHVMPTPLVNHSAETSNAVCHPIRTLKYCI